MASRPREQQQPPQLICPLCRTPILPGDAVAPTEYPSHMTCAEQMVEFWVDHKTYLDEEIRSEQEARAAKERAELRDEEIEND